MFQTVAGTSTVMRISVSPHWPPIMTVPRMSARAVTGAAVVFCMVSIGQVYAPYTPRQAGLVIDSRHGHHIYSDRPPEHL